MNLALIVILFQIKTQQFLFNFWHYFYQLLADLDQGVIDTFSHFCTRLEPFNFLSLQKLSLGGFYAFRVFVTFVANGINFNLIFAVSAYFLQPNVLNLVERFAVM